MATKVFNAILIDRDEIKVHQSPVDLMIREIGDTYSLIVFPEGGRSTGGEIGEFKSGLYYLSKKRPDLELIPVHIDNMNRILPRGEVLPVPLLSCITFGPPMWLEAGESKDEFLDAGPRRRAAIEGTVRDQDPVANRTLPPAPLRMTVLAARAAGHAGDGLASLARARRAATDSGHRHGDPRHLPHARPRLVV